MYKTFFGLKRRPFLAVPDTESYFPIPQMEDARLLIERTVRRGEGISLVFGQAGVGKSLLIRILRKSLEPDFNVASLTSGRLNNAKAFWQNLLHELHLPHIGADETEMQLTLVDHVKNQTSQGLLLLIDESQFLDQIPLDEIRLLLNTDDGSNPLFRVVLAGTSEFEEKLTLPQFDPFNQRVTTRVYLDTLSRTETFQYIAWQINTSRYSEKITSTQNKTQYTTEDDDKSINNNSDKIDILRMDFPHNKNFESIFTDSAKDEIFRLTDGLPRQINQICDAALQLAAQQASTNIDEILIITAWGKLQQINVDADVETLNKRTNKIEKTKTESYDEIVERKKNTLRLKEISSHVEYGSLDDDTKIFDDRQEQNTQPAYHVYKPPYPEDDSIEFKKFVANTETNIIETENITVAQIAANIDESDDNIEAADEINETDEVDDELVEQLISFELSTSAVNFSNESSDEFSDEIVDESFDECFDEFFDESSKSLEEELTNVSCENSPALRNRSNRIGQPVQRQLFASQFQKTLQKVGVRRFFVRFLPPVILSNNAIDNVENLRAIYGAYYCYKKSELKLTGNNYSVGVRSVGLKFTVWRTRIVHSWIGNLSARSVSIVTRIFNTKNYTSNINANTDTNDETTEIYKSCFEIHETEHTITASQNVCSETKPIDHTGCGVLTNSNTDIDSNGAEMNRENLENYGTAVLSGRP
ncbi:MAG: AAA family ATPase, partial [Planctomycetaceae bacterium]|nr:AAA family ATPase [Planctomycetaceae bacterium]